MSISVVLSMFISVPFRISSVSTVSQALQHYMTHFNKSIERKIAAIFVKDTRQNLETLSPPLVSENCNPKNFDSFKPIALITCSNSSLPVVLLGTISN